MKQVINVAKDFSRYPHGRSRELFEASGQRFREDFLVPAFQNYEKVVIELDGTEGYGSSFLEEAFANLIRINGLKKEEVLKKIEIISKDDPSFIDEILGYINQV